MSTRSAVALPADPARPHSREPGVHKDDASLHARVLRAMAGLYRPALQLTEQRTLQGLNLRGGAGALQVRRVSTQPARSLNRPTSRGACVRHPRLSQAAVASDGHPTVGAERAAHLQRLGSAARRLSALGEAAERRCDVASPCGRGCGAQAAGEARCVARFCGSRRTAVCARSEKNDDRDAVVSLYGVTVVTQAIAGQHSDAS